MKMLGLFILIDDKCARPIADKLSNQSRQAFLIVNRLEEDKYSLDLVHCARINTE